MNSTNEKNITLELVVEKGNAYADGKDSNIVSAIAKENGHPVQDLPIVYSVSGNTYFRENKQGIYATKTNSTGESLVHICGKLEETITIDCFVITDKSIQASTEVSFAAPLKPFKIKEAQTINHTLYLGEPNVTWVGANFLVNTTGGSGDVSWEIQGETQGIKVESNNDSSARITITAPFVGERKILATDTKTQETARYGFSVKECIEMACQLVTLEEAVAETDKKLLTEATVKKLFEQWGDLSQYSQWYPDTNYWTDQWSPSTNIASVFNSQTGIITEARITEKDLATKCGFAYTKA